MRCLTPISIRNPAAEHLPAAPRYIEVPCGKCFACRRSRQNAWAFRLLQERDSRKYSYFLTLTYDNDHLPFGEDCATLVKSDLSAFCKRLRSWLYRYDDRLPKDKKGYNYFSYYGCGEYGDNFGRPHYHICIFSDFINSTDLMQKAFNACWTCCDPLQNKIGNVNDRSAKYVAKYCMKQIGIDYSGMQPPFSLMSRRPSIGSKYLTESRIKKFRSDKNFFVHDFVGTPYMLPRYYRDKIFTESEREIISLNNYLDRLKTISFTEDMGLSYNFAMDTIVNKRIQYLQEKDFYNDLKKQCIYALQ